MAKVAIKSEKLSPFGGIFPIMEQFDSMLSPIIDQTLGQRCRSIIGYTILRAIKELTQENISYTSDKGKTYDFNTADKLNALLIKALVSTGELN
ncbi:MAG: IS1380 family transposase, partial [Mediterranea sp.]|nr:IS1380 family transposase [Mediterranea sp.]